LLLQNWSFATASHVIHLRHIGFPADWEYKLEK
jgi:hypothetical protein